MTSRRFRISYPKNSFQLDVILHAIRKRVNNILRNARLRKVSARNCRNLEYWLLTLISLDQLLQEKTLILTITTYKGVCQSTELNIVLKF